MSATGYEPADLRRKALVLLFWFIALSLLFNSLFGDMGLIQGFRQRRQMSRARAEVSVLRAENEHLITEIEALRHDPYRIETIAREEFGLSRPGEIVFLFQEPRAATTPPAPSSSAVP